MENNSRLRLVKVIQALLGTAGIINFLILFFSPVLQHIFGSIQFLYPYSTTLMGIFSIYYALRFVDWLNSKERTFLLASNSLILLISGITLFIKPMLFLLVILIREIYVLIKTISSSFQSRLARTNNKRSEVYQNTFFSRLSRNPAIALMFSFFVTIILGTFLLMHPQSSASGEITPFVDALFTSTSATCVTGLIVYDTGTYWSQVGQIIILILIQIGGLGIMTISTAFAIILGQKLTISTQQVMQNVVGESNRIDFYTLLKSILSLTFIFELVGAVILLFQFRDHLPTLGDAIYHSVFHSISAFCNAGFALYPDSFVSYQTNPTVVMTLSFLIIFGGIGFAVINDIRFNFLKKFAFSRLTLHSKIVLITTGCLLVGGTALFFLSEFRNTMVDFRFGTRILNSWFQSVTCRTAGFNTIDQGNLTNGSTLVSLVLMFIGASPGSTGGGLKTTTIALLMIAMFANLKGTTDINAFKRKISTKSFREVMTLMAIAVSALVALTFVLMLTESLGFKELCFEAVSAFATVGLSMGITADLSSWGKVIVVLLMYLGRIGPMTLIYATTLHIVKVRVQYNQENVSIG